MTASPVSLQDLRRRIYVTAKADTTKRFWGLYVHVVKPETLRTAYALVKRNNGAPGIDGVTFAAIEAAGVEAFLGQLRDELVTRTYRPLRNRRVEIPKDDGTKVRVLGGSRPYGIAWCKGRSNCLWANLRGGLSRRLVRLPTEAEGADGVARVTKAILERKTQVIDLDVVAYWQYLVQPVGLPGVRLDQALAIPLQVSQVADRRRCPPSKSYDLT
jgi:RNA-directed DNA polymerase